MSLTNFFLISNIFLSIGFSEAQDYLYFFNETNWNSVDNRTNVQNLGIYPYSCFGNIGMCVDGFTMGLWLKADKNAGDFILSSGGQSLISEGFYIKKSHEDEIELGVSKDVNIWKTKIPVYDQSWFHLSFTWSLQRGISVYLDGNSIGQIKSPELREFFKMSFDPFPNVVAGYSNEMAYTPNKSSFGLKQMVFINKEVNGNETYSIFEKNKDLLILRCSNVRPLSPRETGPISTFQICHSFCSSKQYNGLMFKNGASCECLTKADFQNLNPMISECSTSDYIIAWASHQIFNTSKAVNLSVEIKPARSFYNITENVLLNIRVQSMNKVFFKINFGDGATIETKENTSGHFWNREGTYAVNVTAVGYFATDSVILKVEVINNQTGLPPENLAFKSDTSSTVPCQVNLSLTAFSETAINCTVRLDKNSILADGSLHVLNKNDYYIFPESGFYDSSFACSNSFGTSSLEYLVTASNRSTSLQSIQISADEYLAFRLLNGKNNVNIFLNNIAADYIANNINDTHVIIRSDALKPAGEYCISLKSIFNEPVINYIYRVLAPLENIVLTGRTFSAQVGELINFVAVVTQGDQVYLSFSCGNGRSQMFYYPYLPSPIQVRVNCTYSNLGSYNISLQVANDIGQKFFGKEVSIERSLNACNWSATNTTHLGVSTLFAFSVDAGKIPPNSVYLSINYGDGATDNLTLVSKNNASIFKHNRVYPKYGIYKVTALVFNNLSSIFLPPKIIQVGQHIASLDLFIQENVITLGQKVIITAKCPEGSPVLVEVNMGDGTILRLSRPADYVQNIDSYSLTNSSNGSNLNTDIEISYQYKAIGTFKVSASASNMFSSTSTRLCPSIVMVNGANGIACSVNSLHIENSTDISKPLVVMRSAVLQQTVTSQLICSKPLGTYKPLYIWTAEKLIGEFLWKPELDVCETGLNTNLLSIKSNTLWYGIYRLNVSQVASIVINENTQVATSLHSQAQVSTCVQIVATPLIAVITSDKSNFYSINDIIRLNLSQSRDPDVTFSNKTGMTFSVFCSYSSTYDGLSISEIMKRVSVVVKNDVVQGILYQFKAKPCFPTKASVMFTKELEIAFLAKDLLATDSIKFTLVLSKDERSSNSSVQFSVLATDLSTSPLDSIDGLLARGDTNGALQILDLVTNGLSQTNDSQGAQNERTQVRGRIISCLNKVTDNLVDVSQLTKTAKVMSDVTSNSDEVTPDAKSDAAKGLNNAADKALVLTQAASINEVQDITKSMLSTAGQILPFASTNQTNSSNSDLVRRRKRSILSKKEKDTKNITQLSCCEKLNGLCTWIEPLPPQDENETSLIDVVDLKVHNWTEEECDLTYPCDLIRIQKRYNQYLKGIKDAENALKKATTTNGLGAVTTVGGILVSKQAPGGTMGIEAPGMNLTVANLASESSSSPNGFSIPKSVGGCGAMALESGNPFTYGDGVSDISGGVKTLLLTSCDGKPIKVENSTEPFTLWLDASPEELAYSDFVLEHVSSQASMSYHNIDLTSNDSALFSNIIPPDGVVFDVYVKYLLFPNNSFYDWKTSIPNSNATGDKQFLFFPPQEITRLNGSYKIGVSLHLNNSDSRNISYSMQTYISSCKYWNENLTSWDTSGCIVGDGTTSLKTECRCNHLTSFAGSFVVPINTIDFNTVFTTEKFLESIPVFCTIIALLVLYILAIVWARHMDKADIAKWGALPLEDNIPSETYYYHVTVQTGMKKNAGTTSTPSFILSGDEADTGVRNLIDGKRKEIATGSINNYILAVDKCLGPLTFLRIWHDNSGKGSKKGWFLDQVEVTDVQTGERYFFVCAQWMAVEEGDGMIERVIPVAGKEDMTQFGQLFSHSVRKKFSNDHLWFSVFSRPTRSSFTRVQRISCCVSLLFLTMIVNCMFFKSVDPDHTTSVHIGPIEITLQQIYISVVSTCIILPPSVIIVTIFRYTKPKRNTVQQLNIKANSGGWQAVDKDSAFWSRAGKTKKQRMTDAIHNITTFHRKLKYRSNNNDESSGIIKKKRGFSFPWWTIYIAWALVFLSIVASAFFTILYSMQWGREKSLDWLKTFFLSFFQSVIVVQPVKVLLLAGFIACILKKPDVEEEESIDSNILKNDEDFTEVPKKDIKEILRRRNRAVQSAGIIDLTKLKETREARLKEIQIEAILKECIVYIFFILVLYFISYQDKDKRSFTFVQHLQNQFFDSGNPTFSQISSYDDVFNWINDTLMSQLYTDGWYNDQPTKDWMESMQTSDHVTIRLGVARIRQLRIKENTCRIQNSFKALIGHCRADYNWIDDDTASYHVGWDGKLSKEETKMAKQSDLDKHNPWLYRDSIELKSTPYMGLINTYKGGGYTFNFYCNPKKTIMKLAELKANNWLDVRTRAVVMEFTVYNVNANLFGSIIMLLEFLSNGAPVATQEVKVFKISSYVGPFGVIIIIFQIIFVIFVVYFMVRTIKLLRKQRKEYFNSFWNILEFLTMIMSIVTIAMYALKIIFGNMAMDILKETGAGDYVNFITIGLWAEIYGIVLAIVVFLSTIKFINMLKFNKRLSMLSETIKFSIKDMRAFLVTFFLYFFAFAQFGYLLFATKLDSYSNFANVIETLFQFFIGSFTFSDYSTAQPIMGPIYFFLFVWVVCFGMQTMFLVIIIEAFQAVRKENQFKKNDYEVGEYIIDKFKGLLGRN